MNRISEVTKRDIFSLFIYGIDSDNFFDTEKNKYYHFGRLSEIDFLKRIYNLKELPSNDYRYNNAEGEIWQHTVNNDDYEYGWVFDDKRFELLNGTDENFLTFIREVFHPAVREEKGYWKEFLNAINNYLRNDGYEFYPSTKISNKDVYDWRNFDPNESTVFIPFSQRHSKEISAHQIPLKLSMRLRAQIYQTLCKFNESQHMVTDTDWHYEILTSKLLFEDLSQFYTPKCFDNNGNYVETKDMEPFIKNNSPFCVFDAIEVFAMYNRENDFASQINAILKLNSVAYRLENEKIESVTEVTVEASTLAKVSEVGLKELLSEASRYYNEGNKKIAVEKIWDAFERLKTYYSPTLDKKHSANKIINLMSAGDSHFITMFTDEFKALTDIGNDYRIRHHETTKIEIADERQYEYFYKRCMALISVAVLYL